MLSELETGKGPWSNIADIVRQTFMSFYERLKSHSDRIKYLERAVLDKYSNHKQEEEERVKLMTLEKVNYNTLLQERDQRISNLENEVAGLKKLIQELTHSLPKKDDLQRILTKKVDVKTLEDTLCEYISKDEHISSLEDFNHQVQGEIQIVEKKIDTALQSIGTAELPDFELLKSTITCEMLIGRWIWEADRKGISFWQETVNTSELIFESSKELIGVRILKKGIYEVSIGCFGLREGMREPNVQLLMDDILLASNDSITSSSVSLSQQQQPRHSTKKPITKRGVTGWTLCEFYLFPSNCEITINYQGDRAQGFLNLKNIHCEID